jgi:hypothetical protein
VDVAEVGAVNLGDPAAAQIGTADGGAEAAVVFLEVVGGVAELRVLKA